MNNEDRLNLKKLINETECENNTDNIRKLKHSSLIRNDIMRMQELKKKHARVRKNEPERFLNLCQSQCKFLFNNYTDIFNKVHKDELDLNIMGKLLDVLKKIEDGLVDQHEGSVMVGTILKELYVDSAMKRGQNIEKTIEPTPPAVYTEGKQISWKQYKQIKEE
jgi:hypothetical protein